MGPKAVTLTEAGGSFFSLYEKGLDDPEMPVLFRKQLLCKEIMVRENVGRQESRAFVSGNLSIETSKAKKGKMERKRV